MNLNNALTTEDTENKRYRKATCPDKREQAGKAFGYIIIILLAELLLCNYIYGASVTKVEIKETEYPATVFIFTDAAPYKHFTMHNPDRIVIDFQNAYSKLPRFIKTNIPLLQNIRTSQFRRWPVPIARVVLDLKKATKYSISKVENGIKIDLGEAKVGQVPAISADREPAKPKEEAKKEEVEKEEAEQPDVDQPEVVTEKRKIIVPGPKPFWYSTRRKRDPFKPWVGLPIPEDSLLDVEKATIVGIMWGTKEEYAVAQDAEGKGHILRVGSRVRRGKVAVIRQKEVVFELWGFGGTRRVTLKLIPKEEREKK